MYYTFTNFNCNTVRNSIQQRSFNDDDAPVYVLVDVIPVLIYFPLLILFNFNLASGPAQSFIFFYQVLPAAIPIDSALPINSSDTGKQLQLGGVFFWGLLTMQSPINELFLPRILPYIALQYCKLAVVVLVLVFTLALIKCIDCPCASWRRPWAKLRRSIRHFREKYAWKGTVLNGFYVIAILAYGFVIQQSFTLLQPANCCPSGVRYCPYYCTELTFIGDNNLSLRLIVAAAVISLVLILPLPLLLLYYPCVPALMQRITKRSSPLITCHKLAPVFDVFQGAYKPKLRFFAAFPLLYRFVIWMLFSGLSTYRLRSDRQFIITFVFILILAIHSLVQPYSKRRHKYIETLYLLNLVIISMMSTFSLAIIARFKLEKAHEIILSILPAPLAYLPLLVNAWYFLWKHNCCKRGRAACCESIKKSRSESLEEEDVQVLPSEVYFDIGEMVQEQTNQN